MSKLKLNVVVNFMGNSLRGLMTLIFVPFYIKFMGIEAYGLVGFFATLQATISLMDMGLSVTLNREMARLSVETGQEQKVRDLVRTLEILYWAIAFLIIILVILLRPIIVNYWINPQHLSRISVNQAILLMGLVIACQFPFALYTGGLMGLQKQVLCNGLDISIAMLRGFGAVLVLWLISPTINAFFSWQLFIVLLQSLLSGIFLWRSLPKINIKPKFQKKIVLEVWRFAAGTSGTNGLSVILTQSDKFLLSKMVSLEYFGYYCLASLIGSGLYLIANPFFMAIFPRFSQLAAQGDKEGLKKLYNRGWQVVVAVVLPVLVVVFLYAKKILLIWTGDPKIAENSFVIVRLIIIGTFLNVLTLIPYALQLAYGWAKMAFNQTLLAVILYLPLLIFCTHQYGILGAACVWVLLNAGLILVWLPYMHKRFFQGESPFFDYKGLGITLACVLIISLIGYQLFPGSTSLFVEIPWLIITFLLALVTSTWATPFTRDWIKYSVLRFAKVQQG